MWFFTALVHAGMVSLEHRKLLCERPSSMLQRLFNALYFSRGIESYTEETKPNTNLCHACIGIYTDGIYRQITTRSIFMLIESMDSDSNLRLINNRTVWNQSSALGMVTELADSSSFHYLQLWSRFRVRRSENNVNLTKKTSFIT